jgi:WhiB family transcriptional regulator, redox-sensing transcriptional regulator
MKAMAEDWRDRAACLGTTGLMFGPVGERREEGLKREVRAKATCKACPVLEHCLTDEDAAPTSWGVRAGMTADERVKRCSIGRGAPGVQRVSVTGTRVVA